MLNKIISVQRIGRFAQSASTPNPNFKKNNLVFAPNAYGKTTICAILRSLSSGDPNPIIGRKRLGSTEPSKVEILFDNTLVKFENNGWSDPKTNLSIFDEEFIQQNVYSGNAVDLNNRRALYRIIVGKDGVELAEKEKELTEKLKAKQSEIKLVEKSLIALSRGMPTNEFLVLENDATIDEKIGTQNSLLKSLAIAEEIKAHSILEEYDEVNVSPEAIEILNTDIDSIGGDAEAALSQHFQNHGMSDTGQTWVSQGVSFIQNDSCPFCARSDLGQLSIVKAYRELFSDSYENLKSKVNDLKPRYIDPVFGSKARTSVSKKYEINVERNSFWKEYCELNDEISSVSTIIEELRKIDNLFAEIVEQKSAEITKKALDNSKEAELRDSVKRANEVIRQINARISALNNIIETRKSSITNTDINAETAKLKFFQTQKTRFSPEAIEICDQYSALKKEKDGFDTEKKAVRESLDEHTSNVIEPYENRINQLLDRFNAGFSITRTNHSYTGGVASSSYELRINNVDVKIGDSRTPSSSPSFKNTLSGGDKSTLALAFFIAQVENEKDLTNRVIIFDDPFNSQDAFRRTNTIFEILNISNNCRQIFLLSHDLGFLRQFWNKCENDNRVSAQIDYHPFGGSKLREFNLEDASQGRNAQELDDLINFRASGAGEPRDIIKKMRVVCETHFRKSYPGYFDSQDNCGAILRKIREAGDSHPAKDKYQDLEEINSYTQDYHHGEDAKGQSEPPLDKMELTGFVDRALTLVNATTC